MRGLNAARSSSGPSSSTSMANRGSSMSAGSSSRSARARKGAPFCASPQTSPATRCAGGSAHAGVSARSAGVRNSSTSASVNSKSDAESLMRSQRQSNASHVGTQVAITSHPRSSKRSISCASSSTRSESSGGTSSNTVRKGASSASIRTQAMRSPSRSRRKQGLFPSIQNTCSNENTVSAYSKARFVFPKPSGATTNRATRLSRRSRAMSSGRVTWRLTSRC